MAGLKDIDTWRIKLGLMPVPLFPEGPDQGFVLLNGARGNFCLDPNPPSELPDRRSQAWSANVGFFVSVLDGEVAVQRWDAEPGNYQLRSANKVQEDLRGFHQQLERLTPPSDLSVIAHSLRVFRSMRGALGETIVGNKALDAFLYMLACAADGADRGELERGTWSFSDDVEAIVHQLEDSEWRALLNELTRGLPLRELKPDFRIVLRHASGPLFQEAHYLAQFSAANQRHLPGIDLVPDPVKVVPQTDAVGVYFTPAALARTVVEEGLAILSPGDRLRIFDPACGSGEFLRECLRQARLANCPGEIALLGWDTSPAACTMSRFTLAWETRGDSGVEWRIEQRDALKEEWPEVDLILMNPPFLSVRDMDEEQKECIRKVLGELARGRYELASGFVWKAAQSLAPGGVVATVVPASLLEGDSFAPTRGALAKILTPHLVARLGSQELFQRAQVDAGLYIAKKNGGCDSAIAVWADHRMSSSSAALRALRRMRAANALGVPEVDDGFSIYLNPGIGTGEGGWAPRPFYEWSFLKRAGEKPAVNQIFKVQQGALTGYNKAFIIGHEYWSTLPEAEKQFFRPAIVNESISHGQLEKTAYVFFPHGECKLSSETDLKARVPTFLADHLKPHETALKKRQISDSTHWWELTRPRNWQIKPASKLVSTYFGQSGSFAWDEAGDFVVVQGYAWHPKGRRSPDRALWLAYLALLNSAPFESLLAATADNVSGGQWNLSTRYVKHIPLPELHISRKNSLTTELAELGEVIHNSGLRSLSEDQCESLRELVEAAYEVEGTPRVESR